MSMKFGDWNVALNVDTYADGSTLYVGLLSEMEDFAGEFEPWGDITRNLCDASLECGQSYVKDFDENDGIREFLINNNLAVPMNRVRQSGFSRFTLYSFNLRELAEYCADGVTEYVKAWGFKSLDDALSMSESE